MQYEKKFIISGEESLEEILPWCEEIIEQYLKTRQGMRMKLVAEEALVNVVKYAYLEAPAEQERFVLIKFTCEGKTFTMEIQDHGVPFNPLKNVTADKTLKLSERKQGGWGRAIMVGFTDRQIYTYEHSLNVLRLEKNID